MCVCVWVYVIQRRTLWSPLLPSPFCGFWGLNTSHQACMVSAFVPWAIALAALSFSRMLGHLSLTSEQMWVCCPPMHMCRDETYWALGQAGFCSVCSLTSSVPAVSSLLPLPWTLLLRRSLWGQASFGSHSSGQLFETQGNSFFKPLFLSVTWGSGVIAGFLSTGCVFLIWNLWEQKCFRFWNICVACTSRVKLIYRPIWMK